MSESSDSSRTARSMSAARQSPMATIESSVTRLLVSTKHLLESLTQWARQEADDKFVLDAYVKLGNDFRAAARSFTSAGVDISDLGDVPRALRIVLESALSEAPTQENLDRFLPNIRSIIVTLLSNLKAKQSRAKELAGDDHDSPRHRTSLAHNHEHVLTEKSPNTRRPNGTHTETSEKEKDRGIGGAERPRRSKLLTELLIKANTDKYADLPGDSDTSRSPVGTAHGPMNALASSDALAKLQQENVILRRASKRFSAYQFAKLTNLSNSQVPRLSSGYGLPPNESRLSAHVSSNSSSTKPDFARVPESSALGSGNSGVSGVSRAPEVPAASVGSGNSALSQARENPSQSAPHIFLRIDDKTKKVAVHFPMTIASLRLLFVEKFAYSPKTGTFPEIYVVDPHTNVSYELEEHQVGSDVQSGCLLLLKAPSYQQELLKDLESSVQGLNSRMDKLAVEVVLQVKEAIESAPISSHFLSAETTGTPRETPTDQSKELEARNVLLTKALKSLQQELRAVKQVLEKRDGQVKEFTAAILQDLGVLKEACLAENSPFNNRSFMDESYLKLSEDSDSLLTRVDDLQDMMEALRKDVAQRGVRLGTKQLKATQREINEVKQQLSGLISFIRDGKPSWKKIWESELDKVCEEQQFFNLQDDLTRDLDEDIRKIEETFELIEKCSVHQSKKPAKRNVFASRMMLSEPGESVHDIRDAVLSEVSALKPDHESRLDAIARAEKMRQRERELESLNQFQEELGDFVGEKKLKSHGGIEELEKKRQQQDAENLKSSFGIV